ncbi:MAG: glycosyltransferase family 4 protein [Clostridia bacterium]|nr:glycosyltransferase family 4 protein [Clostridia bacterium]
MNTIMICLNQLGIGGLETAVFNYTIQFLKRGYRVVILAKDGIYKDKFIKEGAIIENFDFELKDKFDLEKISEMVELIKKYDVEQVHVHQFDCICYAYPACVYSKVPYVAYVHTGILGVYDFYDKCFISYRYLFKLYFESAEKIIAITSQSKEEVIERYKIKQDKIKIINNSIDFNKLLAGHAPIKINNLVIVSRLAEEKMTSIINGINIFRAYLEKNSEARLIVVGDGLCRSKVEECVSDINEYVTFLGQRNDVISIINDCDVVIGLDRCILEAIAMKKIAIISGYEEIKGIVTPENVKILADLNFSGGNVETKSVESIINELLNLSVDTIKSIVEENYKYAYDNLNVGRNIYIIKNAKNIKTEIDTVHVFDAIVKIQNIVYEKTKYTDKVYNDCKENQKWFESIIQNKEKENQELREAKEKSDYENEQLRKQIEDIYNSKRWKIASKFSRIFHIV